MALEIDAALTLSRRTSSADVMLPESAVVRHVSTPEIIFGMPICTSTWLKRCSNWLTAAGSRPSARGSAVAATAGAGTVPLLR